MSRYSAHLEAMLWGCKLLHLRPRRLLPRRRIEEAGLQDGREMVYTCQEKPQGNKQPMRQDLLKKFATGEGTAGRMPYGIATKMVHLQGWNRMEMNKLLSFDDVTEANFESILRRFAIIKLQAIFVDPGVLDDMPNQKDRDAMGCSSATPTWRPSTHLAHPLQQV